jgi:hypothetical protein
MKLSRAVSRKPVTISDLYVTYLSRKHKQPLTIDMEAIMVPMDVKLAGWVSRVRACYLPLNNICQPVIVERPIGRVLLTRNSNKRRNQAAQDSQPLQTDHG